MSYTRAKSASAISLNSRKQQSINFQKSTVEPNIYDLENIRLISKNPFPKSPKNKVNEMKKKRYSEQVAQILKSRLILTTQNLSKPKSVQRTMVDKKFTTRPVTAIKNIISNPLQASQQQMYIEMDENIGELSRAIQEQQASLKEKVQLLRQKVKNRGGFKPKQEQSIGIYLTSLAPPRQKTQNIKVNCDSRNVISYLQELNNFSKKKRKRKYSTFDNSKESISRRKSTIQLFISRSISQKRLNTRESNPVLKKQKIGKYELKTNNLIQLINNIQESEKSNGKIMVKNLINMQIQWGQRMKQQIHKISEETLQALQRKRLNKDALIENDLKIFSQ